MIELNNVVFSYETDLILQVPQLSLIEHRIGIVGANGSGKSTFARLLNGLLLPESGTVEVDGLNTQTHGKEVRRKVGFVFPNPEHQIVFPIVSEDIAFGLKNRQLSKAVIQERIHQLLAQYQLLKLKNKRIYELSGGEKQLIAIVSVLIMEPEYIIFDEPTTCLDLGNKNKVITAIKEMKQKAIVISHDLDFLSDFDRVIVFDQGEIIADDLPEKALTIYQENFS